MATTYGCKAIGCGAPALVGLSFCERHTRVLPAVLRAGTLRDEPLLAAVLARWPGAVVVDVRGAFVPLAPPCRPPTHGDAREDAP